MLSLYWKITLPFILLVILGMGGLGYYLVNTHRQTQLDQFQDYLTKEAKLLAETARPYFIEQASSDRLDDLSRRIGQNIQARITFISLDGNVLGDSDEELIHIENQSTRTEFVQALQTGLGTSQRFDPAAGEMVIFAAVPVMRDQTALGVARVALPLSDINSLTGPIRTTILSTLLATLLVILAALFLTHMITRSIRNVTGAAVKIASGQYDHTIKVDSNDELGRLGHAFNRMSSVIKENMHNLSEEKNKLSTVLYTLSDGVVMTNARRQVLLANPAAENLFGFKEKSALNKPLIEVTFSYETENILNQCLSTMQKQTIQMDTPNNKFLRVYAIPLKTEKLTGAVMLFQDLTELRNLQTMRRQFIGNISHELKTPLAGIKAVVETLKEGAINDSAVAADFLNRADSEVDSLTQLVDELIELTRIETGEAKLIKEAHNLNEVIKDSVNRLATQAERKQIQISFSLSPDLPPVQIDRERIQQVISNIMHNAIKFTPGGGQISITTSLEEKYVITRIKDTGIGIAKEDIIHIFERFFKADRSRTQQGSGLGLAIAKHIVLAHNGRIWVESREGQGATFSFSLPSANK
ncbi:MAG TPA: ATP-binding protein [Dehalococcoidales bacterium]|nr:ATP-binding protein [Dehalococcoidales bacterium]